MSNVFFFEPKSSLSAAKNLNDLISHCQEKLSLYDDQGGWSCNNWKHTQGTRSIAMTFSKYRKVSNPSKFELMDEPFLAFAKAYIRYTQTQKPVSSVTNKMVALRMLHDALLEVHSIVDVLNIDGPTLSYLQELVVERVTNDDRRNKVGYQIQILLNFIREKGISISLQAWINPWPKVGAKAEKTDSESRKWQDERCPSLHQMLILADCFANASAREDIYWSSVLTLLMFAPSRAGELTELTVDCLHKGEGGALGVRWHAKKGYWSYNKMGAEGSRACCYSCL
jgi:hypothetical protein